MTNVLDIAKAWSFWDRDPPRFVERRVTLPKELHDSLCLVIQGVRRSGKSTLMVQLMERYRLDRERCVFVNFEDPKLASHLSVETLDALVEQFRARHSRVKRLYFFLDEIQNVPEWQKWLRAKLERPRDNYFVVTGSNAEMLSGEMSSVLTGRHLTVELFPFDFEEFRLLKPGGSLTDYLTLGGFPQPLQIDDGDMLLRQYFHDIVERDVRENVKARTSAELRQVVQMIFEASGSELSMRRVAGAAGIAVETAQRYVEGCINAYLLFECPYFAFSARKRANRNSKFYPIDTGLRRLVVTKTGDDLGKNLECAVQLRLRKLFGEVYYWRDDGEVDFVVRDGDAVRPFQVSWDGPRERHHRALQGFYERYPQAEEAVHVSAENFDSIFSTEAR